MKVSKTRHLPRKPNYVDCAIGQAIHDIRVEKGLSLRSLANAVSVSYQQIQKYEAGENRITAHRLYQICQLFDVPIESMFAELTSAKRALRSKI
ncbi:XRE family transcriptional regulator [Tardiphaga sp. P9-11]|nr:XRE family transcriptional regulator [Tardiphaga sp. P9-11]